jgi:HrpA-like RNA helicase
MKLVVMSATLDAAKLMKYLGSSCIVKLEGRTFPIEIFNVMSQQLDYIVSP